MFFKTKIDEIAGWGKKKTKHIKRKGNAAIMMLNNATKKKDSFPSIWKPHKSIDLWLQQHHHHHEERALDAEQHQAGCWIPLRTCHLPYISLQKGDVFEFLIKQGLRINKETHICRPEKISRCCCGGTPDCSSTFSFMRVIWRRRWMNEQRLRLRGDHCWLMMDGGKFLYLVICIDIKFDLTTNI
jgi:hypothetical protein